MTRAAILMAMTSLAACSTEAPSYRGITPTSTCAEVRAFEQQTGGVELPSRTESGAGGERLDVSTYRTRIYGVESTAEVACAGPRVQLVLYEPVRESGPDGRATFDLWARELARAFPKHVAASQRIDFYCGSDEISVSLIERAGPVLMVVPMPGVC